MGFVVEEWVGEHNPYRTYPVAGPFATRQQANDEAKKHQPEYGGFITVERERSEASVPKGKAKGKKLSQLRLNERRNRR